MDGPLAKNVLNFTVKPHFILEKNNSPKTLNSDEYDVIYGRPLRKILSKIQSKSSTFFYLANRVENQKLNQPTAEPAVWLSFWFSTRPSAETVTN